MSIQDRLTISGVIVIALGICILLFGESPARITTPNLIVMEQGEHEFRMVIPADVGNGRRIFVDGVSLGKTWFEGEAIVEQIRSNVVFPRGWTGDITVIIRHEPRGEQG